MFRKLQHLLTVTAVTSCLISPLANAEKWDMPMAYSNTNYHTQNAQLFAEAVKVATQGKLDIVVHGGGSLFGGKEIKRAIQTGQAQIGERLLSAHANENAVYGFDSVPFLASSFEDSVKLWKAARPELEKVLANDNLVLLYAVPWPGQGLYFKKSVDSKADTKGVKFRSYNSATARLSELMGMQPVQVEAAELSQALATGVVESMVSSGSTGYDKKVWEQLTHFYDVNAWLPRNYIFVNKDSWDSLDQSTQSIVKGMAMLAEQAGTAKAQQLSDWYISQLSANGMKTQPAEGQLLSDLQSIGKTMAQEWQQAAGESAANILNNYNK
ncbi:C4-dicarboxylate ABC transporter substrate-binding protein ['Osedax' symbiont bacterium Rs2_46_30_T18]|nr:C4-dicarboxylate ABC transporter substrate-binding protein ['Osedax' symbiont bacterium Rs2_46_30_T18]